jgi:hypothetical protein
MWKQQEEDIKEKMYNGELDSSALDDMQLPSIPYVIMPSLYLKPETLIVLTHSTNAGK